MWQPNLGFAIVSFQASGLRIHSPGYAPSGTLGKGFICFSLIICQMKLQGADRECLHTCTHVHSPTHTCPHTNHAGAVLGLENLLYLFCQLLPNGHMDLANESIIHSTSIYWLLAPGTLTPPMMGASQSWIVVSSIHSRKWSKLWLRWLEYNMTVPMEHQRMAMNKSLTGSSHQSFTPGSSTHIHVVLDFLSCPMVLPNSGI